MIKLVFWAIVEASVKLIVSMDLLVELNIVVLKKLVVSGAVCSSRDAGSHSTLSRCEPIVVSAAARATTATTAAGRRLLPLPTASVRALDAILTIYVPFLCWRWKE